MRNTAPFTTIALCAALACSAPAYAQFELSLPETPPAEGQTLLEWADPPILKHTIPENERSDTSTCAATSEYDLDQTAATCWPVLRAAQLFLLADYAVQEPTGDRAKNRRKAIALADETIAFIGQPEWPLQEYLLIKSLELKLYAQMQLEQWPAALETSDILITTIKNDLFELDDFRLSYAYHNRGKLLLRQGSWDEAKVLLEEARPYLDGFFGETFAMRFSDQSEDVIIEAINRGELEYAEATAERFLDFSSEIDPRRSFGRAQHIDLLLYLAARRSDRSTALELLNRRLDQQVSYSRCRKWQFDFPAVLGPLLDDDNIRQILIDGGCDAEQLIFAPTEKLELRDGRSLPPFD